uniref:Uncharacterized protein n=2 Tax=Ignisphaera aggregans TaxID=334771 RepID=A0A7C5TG52_9CREN
MWRIIVKNIILGVFKGMVYYVVFLVLMPWIISSVFRMPLELPTYFTVFIFSIFIGLGVASSIVKPFIGLVLDALSSLFAVYILLSIWGNVSSTSIEYSGVVVEISLEYTPLLVLIVGFTLIYTIIRCFERLVKFEE